MSDTVNLLFLTLENTELLRLTEILKSDANNIHQHIYIGYHVVIIAWKYALKKIEFKELLQILYQKQNEKTNHIQPGKMRYIILPG